MKYINIIVISSIIFLKFFLKLFLPIYSLKMIEIKIIVYNKNYKIACIKSKIWTKLGEYSKHTHTLTYVHFISLSLSISLTVTHVHTNKWTRKQVHTT